MGRLCLYHCVRCHLLWHKLVSDDDVINTNITKAEVCAREDADPMNTLCNECREVGWQIVEMTNANSSH